MGTAVVTPQQKYQEMAISRPDAVFFYGPEGRGPCFMIPGEKTRITWFRGYLVLVSKVAPIVTVNKEAQAELVQEQPLTATKYESSPMLNFLPSSQNQGSVLTIYDLKTKLIAYRGVFGPRKFDASIGTAVGEQIKHVLSEWGEIFVITCNNNIFRLREHDLQSKLEALYAQNLYPMAMSLVTQPTLNIYSSKVESNVDPSPAVVEISTKYADYLYGKGDFDGSIKQFIKTIGHLEPSYVIRKFLDAQRIANLTSYLQALHSKKLANTNHTTLLINCYTKLQDVKQLDKFLETDISFDVETAIRVCRQAGYFQQALALAKKYSQHEWFLKIQVEDLKDYDAALTYLMNLDPTIIIPEISRYGYTLVTHRPNEMIDVLVSCITSYETTEDHLFYPDQFVHFFVNQPKHLTIYLEKIILKGFSIEIENVENSSAKNLTNDSKDILRSLCDMLFYLYLSCRSLDDEVEIWERKCMALLEHPHVLYDLDQALVLCKQNDFIQGLLYIYEKVGMYRDMLNYFTSKGQDDEVVETCKKFGGKDSYLWLMALDYFCNDNSEKYLLTCLRYIDELKICSIVQIIDRLSKTQVTLGVILPFLTKIIEKEQTELDKIREYVSIYRQEIEKTSADLENLENPIIFQNQKCQLCSRQLELPTVSFLCKHSFHSQCIGDQNECAICAPEHDMIEELLKSQKLNAHRQDLFLQKLNESKDKFLVIADYFSKNIF